MPNSTEALLIALLLMPGCFGYFAFIRVYNGKVEDLFEKTVGVVILNVAALLIFSLISPSTELSVHLKSASDFPDAIQKSAITLATLSAISTLVGIISAVAANSKNISAAMRRIGVTLRGHQPSVLTAVIARHPKAFFKFRFKSGGYVIGHPQLYSLHGEECCILLEKAARRPPKRSDASDQPKEYEVNHGILLLNFDDVLCVEILEGVPSDVGS